MATDHQAIKMTRCQEEKLCINYVMFKEIYIYNVEDDELPQALLTLGKQIRA
jgi:hypothetical protein